MAAIGPAHRAGGSIHLGDRQSRSSPVAAVAIIVRKRGLQTVFTGWRECEVSVVGTTGCVLGAT